MPKRRNECEDKRKILKAMLEDADANRISQRLYDHVYNKYINKRQTQKNLEYARCALEHVIKSDLQLARASDFKRVIGGVKKLLRENPEQKQLTNEEEDTDELMVGIVQTTRVGANQKLYRYKSSFVSKGFKPSMEGMTFYLNRGAYYAATHYPPTAGEVNGAFKNQLQQMVDDVGYEAIDKRITNDHQIWRNIINKIQDKDSQGKMLTMESNSAIIEVLQVTPLSAMPADFQPFNERLVMDSAGQRYMDSPLITYHFVPNKSKLELVPVTAYKSGVDDGAVLKESCFWKVIYAAYHESFNKYHSDLKRGDEKNARLTRELVSIVCLGRKYDGGELNMTIQQGAAFFKEYKLGLKVLGERGDVMYEYIPEDNYHSRIRPRTLVTLYKNNHLDLISHPESFCQKKHSCNDALEPPSREYNFKNYGLSENVEYAIAKSYEDLMHKMTSTVVDNQATFVHIIWDCPAMSLTDVVIKLVKEGYSPTVNVKSSISINSFSLKNLQYNGRQIRFNVSVCAVSNGDEEVELGEGGVDTYRKYRELEETLMGMLINRNHLTTYNKQTVKILQQYAVSIPTGAVKVFDHAITPCYIDMNKHYSSCLVEAPHLVSISPFEKFVRANDGDLLRNDRLYLVDVLETRNPVYAVKERTLVFYDELVEMGQDVRYKIIAHVQLILHENKLVPGLVRKIFESPEFEDIPIDMRKGLVNRAIGELGRKKNRKRTTSIFRNEDDATMSFVKMGKKGIVHQIDEEVWIHKTVVENQLDDGFVPINEMIKSMSRKHMAYMWRTLTSYGCEVIAFKTDAVYFMPNGVDVTKSDLASLIGSGLGKGRYGWDYEGSYPRAHMTPCLNRDLECPVIENNNTAVKTTMKDVTYYNIKEHITNRTIVMGGAGCGKTHNVMTYVISKYKKQNVLVVTAWNAQSKRISDEFGVKSITWHKLRGARLDDTVKDGVKEFDVAHVKCIVFDEIMLFDHGKLIRLSKYMEDHTGIDFYATGDPKQLEAINDVIDNEYKVRLLTTSGLFPRVLRLNVNLRLSLHDRERMNDLLEKLHDANNVKEFVTSNFGSDRFLTLDDLKGKGIRRSITFFNTSANEINKIVHSNIHVRPNEKYVEINDVRYHVKDVLVCRKKPTARELKNVIHVNYHYVIRGFKTDNIVVLKEENGGEEYEMVHDVIATHFALPYARTVHSTQGDKINEPYVIADVMAMHVTKNWLLCALTRCVKLNDVYFLETSLKDAFVYEEAKSMVRGYKSQDKKKTDWSCSYDDMEYVSADWIIKTYHSCDGVCNHCGYHMTFEKNSRRKTSVNRLDNALPHVVGNVELCCWTCNNAMPRKRIA